jgi:RHS repeat-associated protein
MTYDAAGNLASKTDFMGQTIAYAYDANNRLTQKLYRDATTVGFTYTATGRRATAVDARGTVAYAYDLRDRIISMKYPDGRKLEYAYDARGNRTLLRAVVGTTTLATTYTYDRAARLATVMDSNGGVYTYGYDANGARTQLTQPNGAVTTYAYNAPNRLTNLKTVHTPSGTTIQSYAYTLGPTGIRTRIDEADGTTRAYGYDALYRLTSESVTGSAGTDYTKTFAYDAVGNRLHQVTTGLGGATVDYAYDARDRLLTENGAPYTWDDNGNMLSKAGDATYAWDAENRLLTASEADGTLVQYAYDPYGVRVQTVLQSGGGGSVQARAYLVDIAGALSQVAVESDGTGAVTESYVRGGEQLLGLIHAAGPAGYYAQDGLGSVRKLVARDGGVTDSYGYTGFGEALGLMGGDAQPYRFGGEEYDLRTGLLYNRARWLAPSIGSFLAIDSVAGNVSNPKSLHRYAYAYLDPIDNVDPTGKVTLVEVSTAATIAGILSVVPEQSLAATKQPERYNCATSPEPFTKVSAKFQNGWAIAAGAAAHGSILASAAVVVADAMRTVNCCAKGVITALNLAGLTVPARDAWELAGILAREERFVELADYDLFEPPIGSIGIVANGSMTGEYVPSFGPAENIARLTHARSLDYGHAFIYVGGQLEASDHLQPYSVRLGVGLRMFLPVQ